MQSKNIMNGLVLVMILFAAIFIPPHVSAKSYSIELKDLEGVYTASYTPDFANQSTLWPSQFNLAGGKSQYVDVGPIGEISYYAITYTIDVQQWLTYENSYGSTMQYLGMIPGLVFNHDDNNGFSGSFGWGGYMPMVGDNSYVLYGQITSTHYQQGEPFVFSIEVIGEPSLAFFNDARQHGIPGGMLGFWVPDFNASDFQLMQTGIFNVTKVELEIIDNTPVPEPATMLLLGLGLMGLVGLRRKIQK